MTTIASINTAIIEGSFTNDQLNSIASAITFARSQLTRVATCTLTPGVKVKFTSTKTGQVIKGNVVKVNRKFVIVKNDATLTNWRVPGNMLSAI